MMLTLDTQRLMKVLNEDEFEKMEAQALLAEKTLLEGKGFGSDFLAWRDLPMNFDRDEFERILKAAEKIKKQSDLLVVVGIGGSYLGARAVVEALTPAFTAQAGRTEKTATKLVYAGNSLSSTYLSELLSILDEHDVSLNVISKSGTTTETALAFRFLRSYMEKRYGEDGAARRIFATTDAHRGALRELAIAKGYERFVVPDDIGGRYSVLTAVGLLPIAAAGLDIEALMGGARAICERLTEGGRDNPALRYAMARNLLYRRGYHIEVLADFEPSFHYFSEWWKQLFGESEGKDGKGIFPAAVSYTTDLHSMGQFVQDGSRSVFETVLHLEHPRHELIVPEECSSADGLDYLAGCPVSEISEKAMLATTLAHEDGGCPNMQISIDKADEKNLGELIYFFERACGLSAYLNGVNPFDQPGVEAYKKNMFALLGKPGYEELGQILNKRLS